MTSGSTALLQCQQLLSTEGLVMDLTGSFDKILEVGTGQEVSQIDELAVSIVFDVDHSPTVLPTTHLFASYIDVSLTSNNGEGDNVFDLSIDGAFFFVVLFVVVWVHTQVVESEFLLDAFFECATLLEG